MRITSNRVLESLNGLQGLQSIPRNLAIMDNAALRSLEGLDQLTSLGADLWIDGNMGLLTLQGLGLHPPLAVIGRRLVSHSEIRISIL